MGRFCLPLPHLRRILAVMEYRKQTIDTNLTGKLLIAMPEIGDARFAQSVVFLCSHDSEQAMGIIINRPLPEIGSADVLAQLNIPAAAGQGGFPVCFGGPVETGRGFVLHQSAAGGASAQMRDQALGSGRMGIGPDYVLTTTRDILEDIASGRGPQDFIMALGYAGWGAGQLEQELAQNVWLVTDANRDLVFKTAMAQKWAAALGQLGISPALLSGKGGRA